MGIFRNNVISLTISRTNVINGVTISLEREIMGKGENPEKKKEEILVLIKKM